MLLSSLIFHRILNTTPIRDPARISRQRVGDLPRRSSDGAGAAMDPSSEHTNVGADYSRDGTILFSVDDVPSFAIPDTVKEIDLWAFKDCRSLKEVHMPDSVTFIGSSAFEGCVSLGPVHIPASVRYNFPKS